MTVLTTAASQTFVGNSVATAFPCGFAITASTDITVSYVNPADGTSTPLALNTDYTVAGIASNGFTVNTTVAVPTGMNLFVERSIAYTQPTDFTNQGAFFPSMHETAMDRLEMQIQQVNAAVGAAASFPQGLSPAPSNVLPVPAAGSLIGWNAAGTALVNVGASGVGAGSIADVNIASNAAIQSGKLSYQRSEIGAVTRTVQAKLAERISLRDFGAVGDGVTDDTAAVQAWVNACVASGYAGYVPPVAANKGYRLTATINLTGGFSCLGEGCEPQTVFSASPPQHGAGSWFYINHAGKGFSAAPGAGGYQTGIVFSGIGTYRDQPVPNGGAFTPNANDYDFYLLEFDALFRDCVLLNPTKGIGVKQCRTDVRGLKGQPLGVGIDFIQSNDTDHISDIHFSPFWSNDAGVRAYMISNSKAIRLGECDNPMLSGIFTLGYWRSISCEVDGVDVRGPLKVKLSNFDLDNGGTGFYVDGACANVTALLSHGYILGSSTVTDPGMHNIDISGATSRVQIDNVECDLPMASCLSVTGANCVVRVGNFALGRWGAGTSAATGVAASSTSTVTFASLPVVTGAAIGTGAMFGTAAGITCPLGAGFVSAGTDANGKVTITHNAGAAPRVITCVSDDTFQFDVRYNGTATTTTFSVTVRNPPTNAVVASHGVGIHWRASY